MIVKNVDVKNLKADEKKKLFFDNADNGVLCDRIFSRIEAIFIDLVFVLGADCVGFQTEVFESDQFAGEDGI